MDMTMVDVTDVPEVEEGSEVIIFNSVESLEKMASSLNTIPYEVMSGISQRVHRVYFSE
jgi:alanine racemase